MDEYFGQYKVVELLAVSWSDEMKARFPNADHSMCRVNLKTMSCLGWHCNRCGAATNYQGMHSCPDRPA